VNSVRPLVVSQAPAAAQGSSGFGRFLVGLALVAGVAVSLYRNDVLRDAAHSAHQDGLYARLEAALGGPAFGTLRGGGNQVANASAPPIVRLEPLSVKKEPAPAASGLLVIPSALNPTPAQSNQPAASPIKNVPAPKLARPAPVAVKPTAKIQRQNLDAAIGRSMSSPLPKANAKASEYDPLNPKL
jgi:hypothetical protein